jgi:DNA end-binding protein Ku
MMETMNFHDEVVPAEDLDELVAAAESQASDREVAMAKQLIDSLTTAFEPDRYSDSYREQVLALIERKAAGEDVAVQPEAPEPARVPDLMAALEASLAAVRSGDSPDDGEKPKRKPAAKRREPAQTG